MFVSISMMYVSIYTKLTGDFSYKREMTTKYDAVNIDANRVNFSPLL
jgi:hypothetical protein